MYNIIPLILILASLTLIITIVVRKFSILSNLDVENIPAEKEAKFKERIISNRLKRNFFKWWSRAGRLFNPLSSLFKEIIKWLHNKLDELKSDYKETVTSDSEENKIILLFKEVEEFKKQDDLVAAEKKLIEIISLNSKNIKAFKELGGLYFEQKNYQEAEQTFKHVLKLKENDEDIYESLAQIAKEKGDLNSAKADYLKLLELNKNSAQTFFNLALVYLAMGNMKETISNLKKALKIEPNNPRFLDSMLEISIIIKDKILALDALGNLKKVNPDNQKIEEFKKQINEL